MISGTPPGMYRKKRIPKGIISLSSRLTLRALTPSKCSSQHGLLRGQALSKAKSAMSYFLLISLAVPVVQRNGLELRGIPHPIRGSAITVVHQGDVWRYKERFYLTMGMRRTR